MQSPSFIMNFYLPKSVEIDGKEYAIRYDFRVILEIITMLQDDDLTGADKTDAIMEMFYVDAPEDVEKAVEACFKFIDNSNRPNKKAPRIVDWEQDFEYIIAPVNRVLGFESRGVEYDPIENKGGLHWWTFLSAYMEIGGDCLFSQIVSIRDKQARRKKLEKHEREWLRRNGDLVRLKPRYTSAEDELIKEWTGGKTNGG